jgi:hypothetical protein
MLGDLRLCDPQLGDEVYGHTATTAYTEAEGPHSRPMSERLSYRRQLLVALPARSAPCPQGPCKTPLTVPARRCEW